MRGFIPIHRDSATRKMIHPIGKSVYCVHCYRTLGAAETTQQQRRLEQEHTCVEGQLARQPGSPPPFN